MTIFLTIFCSYLAGSIPFGYLIGRWNGKDIRTLGSGNIGATNVTRVIGKGWGRLCFALDFLKGFLPVLTVKLLTGSTLYAAIAVFCTVIGHMLPVWLKFKGGKGVSTAAGGLLAFSPLALISAAVVWVVLFFASRYVSLARIFAAVSLPLFCLLYSVTGLYCALKMPSWDKLELGILAALAVLTVLKHTSNIKRLCNGTENRFERKKKETEDRING